MSQGYTSLLAPWTSGAGVNPSLGPPTVGFISLLGFWTSGAGQSGVTPPVVPPPKVITPVYENWTVWRNHRGSRRKYRQRSWSSRIS